MSSSKVGSVSQLAFTFEKQPYVLEVQPIKSEKIELFVYPTDNLTIALQKSTIYLENLDYFSKKARFGYGGMGGAKLKKNSKKKKFMVDWITSDSGISYRVPKSFNEYEVLPLPNGKYILTNSAKPDKKKEIDIISSNVTEVELSSDFLVNSNDVNTESENEAPSTEMGEAPQLFDIKKEPQQKETPPTSN